MNAIKNELMARARQNVILEYGFFKAIKDDDEIMVIRKKNIISVFTLALG